jgi:hypothetical protein
VKREQIERHRLPKRENRITMLRVQHLEEDFLLDDEDMQLVNTIYEK